MHQIDIIPTGQRKCYLLSDRTKQARLHKHFCSAIKALSVAPPLHSAQPLLSSSFEVVPRSFTISQPPICHSKASSLPSYFYCHNLLLEQPANVAVVLPEVHPPRFVQDTVIRFRLFIDPNIPKPYSSVHVAISLSLPRETVKHTHSAHRTNLRSAVNGSEKRQM